MSFNETFIFASNCYFLSVHVLDINSIFVHYYSIQPSSCYLNSSLTRAHVYSSLLNMWINFLLYRHLGRCQLHATLRL